MNMNALVEINTFVGIINVFRNENILSEEQIYFKRM